MKWLQDTDEFFIGYIPKAPRQMSSFLRKVMIILGFVVALLGFLLARSKQSFYSNAFEYGVPTTLEGTLQLSPVPHLRVNMGNDAKQNSIYQTILLVGFGKAGAIETLKKLEQEVNYSLQGKLVKMTGSLMYGDGKALLQISDESNVQLTSDKGTLFEKLEVHELERATIHGEIVDPKCYFGVMNPGEGKAHRSCAIRCISGGIPPVFYSKQLSEYFLLVGENFKPLNHEVLNIVGDQVSLTGRTFQFDDWKVIQVENKELHRLSLSALNHRMMAAMESDMTQCGMN